MWVCDVANLWRICIVCSRHLTWRNFVKCLYGVCDVSVQCLWCVLTCDMSVQHLWRVYDVCDVCVRCLWCVCTVFVACLWCVYGVSLWCVFTLCVMCLYGVCDVSVRCFWCLCTVSDVPVQCLWRVCLVFVTCLYGVCDVSVWCLYGICTVCSRATAWRRQRCWHDSTARRLTDTSCSCGPHRNGLLSSLSCIKCSTDWSSQPSLLVRPSVSHSGECTSWTTLSTHTC